MYASLEVDDDGAASGEVHFACEPKYPAPISIGVEFSLHVPHPESILGDNVVLTVRLVDDSGSVTGYVLGSAAQFRPSRKRSSGEPAEKDDLLPLLRRKMFDQELDALGKAATEAEPVSLLMLDLDYFKSVNDTHGHPVGDEVLIECANVIARRCRHKGKVYRFGGEEIAVLLPNFTVSEAVALAESIRSQIETSRMTSKKLSITASIGVATAPNHATEAKELLKVADEALYAAKRLGRNLVRIAGETPTGNLKKEPEKHKQSEQGPETPNLILIGTDSRLLHRMGDEFCKNVSLDLRAKFPLQEILLAEIKNASKSSKTVGTARRIKAELLVNIDSSQRTFGPLAWTETISNTVDIEMGDAKEVILVVRFGKGFVPESPRGQWRIAINPRSRLAHV